MQAKINLPNQELSLVSLGGLYWFVQHPTTICMHEHVKHFDRYNFVIIFLKLLIRHRLLRILLL